MALTVTQAQSDPTTEDVEPAPRFWIGDNKHLLFDAEDTETEQRPRHRRRIAAPRPV